MLPLAWQPNRGLAKDVPAAAIIPEVVVIKRKSLEYFHVQIQETAHALFREISGRDGSDG